LKKLKPYPRKKYSAPLISELEDYPEIAIMQSLSHPNVLPLKGIVQQDKGFEMNHYMVLEFGIELLEFSKHKEVMLSRELIRCLLQQLTAAVCYLHSQGVMHRDIKPDNIYLMNDGTLKLGDFSIATSISRTAPFELVEGQEQHERTGNVTTRQYRAPEIIYGSRTYDQSIDIWSFGCTIAELLLGQHLFPGTTDIHQLELIFSVLGCPVKLPLCSKTFGLKLANFPTTFNSIIPSRRQD
jgi:serine/threonine protein kinase